MQDGQEQPKSSPAQPPTNWQFEPQTSTQPTSGASAPQPSSQVDWTASEFVAHHKGAGWYLGLVGLTLFIAALVFVLARDVVSTVVVIVVGICFGFFAARKPRELHYTLNSGGIQMGEKFYPYNQFKSFSLVQEDAAQSVWLMPLKRFMPIITVYFDPSDQDKIATTLSNFLPFENRQPDAVDKLMHRLRF